MPYQVKSGSFLIVAPSLPAALKLYDEMRTGSEEVSIRDMEGREIDIDEIRPVLNDGEPS
ncbi:hypothetical protein WHZ77_11470 [Bradyrhizobium sp. A5]|uniref:hypothetical protein n=1 Tax=Bradyrhizobium sp. A5 TaxID=3133696 RepID=UPI003243CD0F